MPSNLFPLLLIAHIALAISLVLPSILLPFALRTRRATVDSDSRVVQGLLYAQTHGTIVIGLGLAVTGLGLVLALGANLLQQTWLLVALTIYFVNLGLAFFIQRPNLRRLVGVTAAADDRVWKERAKRQRYVSYLMAGLVGAIGFLMSTKPVLW
jgi:predicted tellurium resistance membrane protein TerC